MGGDGKLTHGSPDVGSEIELELDDTPVDDEGRAAATTADGLSVRVTGGLPGERVRAEVEHVSKRRAIFARVTSVERASADRVPPGCVRFLDCGGCDFLHLRLGAQHDLKRAWLARDLGLPLERIDPVVSSPRPLAYRALAKLVVGPGRVLGSYRSRSHDVVDMRGCLVHTPEAEAVVDAIRDALAICPEPIDLRYVLVRASIAERRVIVTLVAATPDASSPRFIAEQIRGRPDVARVVLNVNAGESDALLGPGPDLMLHGDPAEALEERLGPVVQSLEAGAFAQVNPLAAAELYRVVARAIAPKDKRILDLYSGSGGIALTLGAEGAAEVLGIEANEDAVRAAEASARRMGLSGRVTFRAAPVEQALAEAGPADALVLNPPRKGASLEVIERIAERAPIEAVYVSCNPRSLARDLEWIAERAELELVRVTPVDLFPQTLHVETVVSMKILKKAG